MHHRYNTGDYRKLYKSFIKRYDERNLEECIEPRVREFCETIRKSGLGVSLYSCEGHDSDTDYDKWEGYVMLAARNRDAASKLTELFNHCTQKLISIFGWGARPEVEVSIASLNNEEESYPCIVIRNPHITNEDQLNVWWDIVTRFMQHNLKHHIAVNPEFQEVA